MYKYGIGVAGILGTVMIIFGGFQWATSGGNSAIIGSAKKKITGSIIGMLLAVISYTILNTINPALVNLRMPGVFMINSMGLPPAYCDELPNDKLVSESPNGPYTISGSVATCGKKYYVDGTGNQMCEGRMCSGGIACLPVSLSADGKISNTPVCLKDYDVLIKYSITGFAQNIKGTIMPSSWWVAQLVRDVLENDESSGWLYTDTAEYFDACADENNNFKIATDSWPINSRVKIVRGNKNSGKTYSDMYVYYRIRGLDMANTSKCPDGYKNKVLGGIFMHKVDRLGTSTEFPILVTLDRSGKDIIAGSRNRIIVDKNGQYTYFSSSTKGYFEANIDDSVLDSVFGKTKP